MLLLRKIPRSKKIPTLGVLIYRVTKIFQIIEGMQISWDWLKNPLLTQSPQLINWTSHRLPLSRKYSTHVYNNFIKGKHISLNLSYTYVIPWNRSLLYDLYRITDSCIYSIDSFTSDLLDYLHFNWVCLEWNCIYLLSNNGSHSWTKMD